MHKYILVFLCIITFSISGCSHPEIENVSHLVVPTKIQNVNSANKWFFLSDNVTLSADATVNCFVDYERYNSLTPTKTEKVNIKIQKIADINDSFISKLAIEPIEDHDGYLNDARLNLYFYVTSDKIYRIWSYIYENNIIKEFYDDDQLLIQTLNTEEKIINNSYLVWQQEELLDSLEEGETGTHYHIEVKDNQILSSMWDSTPNGETYFYENFSWELGKGLTGYSSGFRAEREILYLNNISEVLETE